MRSSENSPRTTDRGKQQKLTVLHPEFFVDALLENSSTKPGARSGNFIVSGMAHSTILALILMAPLYFTEGVKIVLPPAVELIAPPPRLTVSARPIPAEAPLTVTPPRVLTPAVELSLPKLPLKQGEPAAPGLLTGIAPGVPEAAARGQLDGVIGGIGSGVTASYVPQPAAVKLPPRAAIPVGGDIKEPRLRSVVDPVYPRVLRQTRVSGDVVIDAVVDANGDVVQMRPISGQRLLLLAAMDAVRQWKYQPTLLNGQPIPVIVRVTVTFRLKPSSP